MDLTIIDRNLNKMKSGGASKEEMQTYLDFVTQQKPALNLPTTQAFTQGRPQDDPASWQRQVSRFARPALEMGGLIGGGALAAPTAIPTFGTAPVAAAAGGYAMGSSAADRLDEFLGIVDKADLKTSSKKMLWDVKKGAEFEMGGRLIAPVAGLGKKGIWKLAEKMKLVKLFGAIKKMFPSLSDRGILLKAKETLKTVRQETPVIKKTAKETQELLKRTGVKEVPTYAQKTGGMKAGYHEQSVSAKNAELADILKMKDATITEQAGKHVSKRFPAKEGVGDAISAVGDKQAKLLTTAERLRTQADDILAKTRVGVTEKQIIGKDIYSATDIAKAKAKETIKTLYAKIPGETMVENKPLRKGLADTLIQFRKIGGGEQALPKAIIKQIKQNVKGSHISFDKLKDLRSQVSTEIRQEYLRIDPNLKRAAHLQSLKKGINNTLEQMRTFGGKQAQIAHDYKIATETFLKYDKTFRKGAVGDILRPGRQTSGLNTLHSDMPAKFFQSGKTELADDLIAAIGKGKAKELIQPYANVDFLTKSVPSGNFNLKTAQKWLITNKNLLQKYDLYDDFKSIVTSKKIADEAMINLQAYQKTVASTILEADAGKVIKNIFSGKGKIQSARTAIDLMNLPGIKGNPVAIKGIQNSFKDFMLKEMELSGVDVLGNPLRSIAKGKTLLEAYTPAMRILYKDSPQKIQAITDYHKLLEMIARNKNLSFAGGSTTTEKIFGTRKEVLGSIGRNISQLIAIQQGKGWFFSSLKNLWGSLTGAPGKFSQAQIDKLLTEAIYNPEVAQTIMMATQKVPLKIVQMGLPVGTKITEKGWKVFINQRMEYHLSGAGVYAVKKLTKKKIEE